MKRSLMFFLLIGYSVFGQIREIKMEINNVIDSIYRIDIGSAIVVSKIGEDGILLSDCGYNSTSEKLDSLLESKFGRKVKYIINTHWHHDHTGGNLYYGKKCDIISSEGTRTILSRDAKSELWQENYEKYPQNALPKIIVEGEMSLFFDDEIVRLKSYDFGHSSGDLTVYFEKDNVLHVGDLLFSLGFPAIDVENGGNPLSFISCLDDILKSYNENVIIIPGHGPNFTKKKLREYREMLSDTYSIIRENFNAGLSLVEIQDKNVLKGFEKWEEGYFSCNDWIEIVVFSLNWKNRKN